MRNSITLQDDSKTCTPQTGSGKRALAMLLVASSSRYIKQEAVCDLHGHNKPAARQRLETEV